MAAHLTSSGLPMLTSSEGAARGIGRLDDTEEVVMGLGKRLTNFQGVQKAREERAEAESRAALDAARHAARTVTSADNGRTVRLRIGEHMAVQLDENPSTGYRWAFDDIEEKLIAVHNDGYVRTTKGVGGGGTRQWRFEAKAVGRTEIRCKRWQKWRGEASVQERFAVKLIIGAGNKG
jgi:inhibitor of cysteine peptidase